MQLHRTPLLLFESDTGIEQLSRAASSGGPADEDRYGRAMVRAGRGAEYHTPAIRTYVDAVRRRNDLVRKRVAMSRAYVSTRRQTGYAEMRAHLAASHQNRQQQEEAHKASVDAREALLKRAGDVSATHEGSRNDSVDRAVRARKVRREAAHTIDRSFFPEGTEGDHAHHEVLGHLHRVHYRGTSRIDDSRGYATPDETKLKPRRRPKHVNGFAEALRHHGYDKSHKISAEPTTGSVRITARERSG